MTTSLTLQVSGASMTSSELRRFFLRFIKKFANSSRSLPEPNLVLFKQLSKSLVARSVSGESMTLRPNLDCGCCRLVQACRLFYVDSDM